MKAPELHEIQELVKTSKWTGYQFTMDLPTYELKDHPEVYFSEYDFFRDKPCRKGTVLCYAREKKKYFYFTKYMLFDMKIIMDTLKREGMI